MKNTLAKLTAAFVCVGIWAGLLTLLGLYLFRTYSVSPTFPYYYVLLLKVRDAAYALWGYFDGVHYLRLIDHGYVDMGTQAFFPLYPHLTRALSDLTSLNSYLSGIIVSLVSLALSLYVLWQIYPKAKLAYTLFLLLFPTSFFFAALYTESLFLFLSLSFFWALRHNRYFLSALLAALASSTRLVGVFLGLSLALTLYQKYKLTRPFYLLALTILSISGFLSYCTFLYLRFDDPLIFLHVQDMFGADRSGDTLILLPQVLYRYLKMILTVDPSSFLYQRIWLEIVFFVTAIVLWFKNLRSQSSATNLYVISSLLLPTLTGTLSSIPRYVLVLVPFLLPYNIKNPMYFILLTFNFLLLIYLFSHFAHGTFVA